MSNSAVQDSLVERVTVLEAMMLEGAEHTLVIVRAIKAKLEQIERKVDMSESDRSGREVMNVVNEPHYTDHQRVERVERMFMDLYDKSLVVFNAIEDELKRLAIRVGRLESQLAAHPDTDTPLTGKKVNP